MESTPKASAALSLWCGRALLLKEWQQRVDLGFAQRPAAIRIEPAEERVHHDAPALADLGANGGYGRPLSFRLSLGGGFVPRWLGPNPSLGHGTNDRIKGGPTQLRVWVKVM